MIHRIAYVLVAGVFFWLGNAFHEASKPVQPFRIVRPQPTTAANILTCPVTRKSLEEYYRTCRAQKRSDSTQERNSK